MRWVTMLGLLTISWTLCYEEQFYLIAGLLRRWYFPGVALVTLFVFACPIRPPGFFFDGLWLHFAAGVAACADSVGVVANTGAKINAKTNAKTNAETVDMAVDRSRGARAKADTAFLRGESLKSPKG